MHVYHYNHTEMSSRPFGYFSPPEPVGDPDNRVGVSAFFISLGAEGAIEGGAQGFPR